MTHLITEDQQNTVANGRREEGLGRSKNCGFLHRRKHAQLDELRGGKTSPAWKEWYEGDKI